MKLHVFDNRMRVSAPNTDLDFTTKIKRDRPTHAKYGDKSTLERYNFTIILKQHGCLFMNGNPMLICKKKTVN